MNDFKFATLAWACVVAVLLICISLTSAFISKQESESDKKCLDSGKSITYKSFEGSTSKYKECK